MLNTQLVANLITETLNTYGKTDEYSYTFVVGAEIKEDKRGGYIAGILRTVDSPVKPVKNYKEVNYTFVVDLLVYAARTNEIYLEVSEIVGKMISQYNGDNVNFGTGKGTMSFTAGRPDRYDNAYGTGDEVPLSFTVNITYTDNDNVLSSDKHWLLDGEEIPFLSESVSIETEGLTRKIYTEQYSKTLKTGQMRFYSFVVPYASEMGVKLQQLILNNTMLSNRVHTLSYYDGQAFTSENPFTTKVIVYRSGRSYSEMPKGSSFEITFTDADDGASYPQYYFGLLDFPFDRQSEDSRYFTSESEQQAYFENKVAGGAAFVPIFAPNLDSLDVTKQVYDNYLGTYDLLDLVKKNYAVIKVYKDATSAPEYLYYFVTNVTIGEGRQVMYDLHLDTVQTYFFDSSVSFANCLIERAHLNRFEEADSTHVKFVTDPKSKIYNAEDALNYPKRLIKRTKVEMAPLGVTEVDNWLKKNVDYWVYVYLDPTYNEFNVYNPYRPGKVEDKTAFFQASVNNDVISPPAVYYYPVYKKNRANQNVYIIIKCYFETEINEGTSGTRKFRVSEDSRKYFETMNPNYVGYYYALKASVMPPFLFRDTDMISQFSIDSGGNLEVNMDHKWTGSIGENPPPYLTSNAANGIFTEYGENNEYSSYALFTGIFQIDTYAQTEPYLLPYNADILKSDVKNGTDRLSYNPKLNGQNFRELVITASSGDSFTYDIQKLQQDSVTFLYTEPFSPEITKYYMRVNAPCGLYTEGTESNYMGLVGSTDNSIAFLTNAYAEFIANNKNFWMQSNMKIVMGTMKSAIGIGSSFAEGKYPQAIGGAVGGSLDFISSIIDRNMTVDNMKQAPDQLKNANGNLLFNLLVTDFGLYVEEFAALDGDMQSAFDFMELYGFSVNSIGNVKDYVNIRKYHNYIKAQLQGIIGAMSNIAREDLRERFSRGIRFWNVDTPDYSQENYEKWLDE